MRSVLPVAAAIGLLGICAGAPVAQAAPGRAQTAGPPPGQGGPFIVNLPAPLSTTDCLSAYGIRCYTPAQLRTAYDLGPVYNRGITGSGRTIVIPVPFGSPTIRHDLHVFDAQFGIPDPDLQIVEFGTIPPYDPNDFTRIEWAAGTTLQVEYAHAIAPGAKIVIAETSVAGTGVTGLPELMNAENSLINSGVGDVISQIIGTAEDNFPGFSHGDFSSLQSLRYAFKNASDHHVTVLAAAGRNGVTDFENDDTTLYPHPVVRWPSSDPLVTSVGSSQLYLDDAGSRLQADTLWNDGHGVGGGGVSSVFPRPIYQIGVRNVVGNHRGTPDISMSGALDGGIWVYLSFGGAGGIGWNIFNGGSESVPLFAGIVALADQMAGHRLGLVNPTINLLGALGHAGLPSTGLVDITRGNNSYGGVAGYDAARGYDLVSGWGTIDAAKFVPALARLG